jgi:ssDNA thymidine ADP-ribosyltransferase, DarT
VLAEGAGAAPEVDISAVDNRELRREVRAGEGAEAVAGFVPFFLVPNALLWERMRDSEADYRLAEAAHSIPAADFVVLVSTVRAAGDGAVLADGDAADPATRFSLIAESAGRMPRRLYDEEDAMREAEFLVPREFPVSAVTLVGVANDKVRGQVRELLTSHGFSQKVSVYPPWFQPSKL